MSVISLGISQQKIKILIIRYGVICVLIGGSIMERSAGTYLDTSRKSQDPQNMSES